MLETLKQPGRATVDLPKLSSHSSFENTTNNKCGRMGVSKEKKGTIDAGLQEVERTFPPSPTSTCEGMEGEKISQLDNASFVKPSNINGNNGMTLEDSVFWARSGKGAPFWPSRYCTKEEILNWPEEAKYNPNTIELNEFEIMSSILNKLMQNDSQKWFCSPVDAKALGLKDYHDVVKNPMDLGTIRKKIDSGGYSDIDGIKKDIELTFQNARLYNPPGIPVYRKASALLRTYGGECLKAFGKHANSINGNLGGKIAVFYFGSHEFGMVSRTNMLSYTRYYQKYAGKKSHRFRLALEEASELVMREKHAAVEDSPCRVCGLISDRAQESNILICDRCYGEVHMSCMDPPLTSVPSGDFYCPVCIKEAPLTFEILAKEKKEKEKQKGDKGTIGVKRQRSPLNQKDGKSTNPPKKVKVELQHKKMDETDMDISKVLNTKRVEAKKTAIDIEVENKTAVDVRDGVRARSAKTSRRTESRCSVCRLQSPPTLSCGFNGCPKVYHKICVGDVTPNYTRKSTKEKVWVCPWHLCAVCHAPELEENSQLLLIPWPKKGTVPSVSAILADKPDASSEETKKDLKNNEEGGENFIRCRSCTLALCAKHSNAPVLLLGDKDHDVVPKGMQRNSKLGFFQCSICASRGGDSEGLVSDKLRNPRSMVSARFFVTVFFDIAYSNLKIKEQLEKASCMTKQDGNDMTVNNRPFSFDDVRKKVLMLRYGNLSCFKSDMALAFQNAFSSLETADDELGKFISDVRSIIKKRKKHYKMNQVSDDEIQKTHSLIQKKKVVLSSSFIPALFQSLSCKDPVKTQKSKNQTQKSKNQMKTQKSKDQMKSQKSSKPKEKLLKTKAAKGVKVSLLNNVNIADAVAALTSMPKAKETGPIFPSNSSDYMIQRRQELVKIATMSEYAPPVEGEIGGILDTQSDVLRQALRNISQLKKSLTTSSLYKIAGETEHSEVMNLGDMSTAAELKLANRNLRKQLADAQKLLAEERAARKKAEIEVEKLRSQMASISSSEKS